MSLSDPVSTQEPVQTDEASPRFDRWETPEFEPGMGQSSGAHGVSVTQLEALQKQVYEEAYEEAYAVGIQEGFKVGAQKTDVEAKQLGKLIQQLARPFERLDESVEKQVVQLAMIVARHIIRREIKTEPAHVIGSVREALAVLPIAARDVRVRLHPEDAAIVAKYLKPAEGERAWSIQEDPVLTRGGCRIETEFSHVDARIESRISALIATLFGDERESDDSPGPRELDNE